MKLNVWNLGSVSHSVAWIVVVKLKLLPFNAILSSEKWKKSHGTKLGEYGGCAMTIILFLARDSPTSKAEWAGALSWWRNQYAKFHLTWCFHCTFSCRCRNVSICNVGLGFVFSKQIHNAQLCECWKNHEHSLHIWANLSCLLSAWRPWTRGLWQILLGFRVISIHRLITCDYLQKEVWVCFKLGMNFAANRCLLWFFFKRSDLTKMKFSACQQYRR